ncbi:MAG: 4-alpha-glucanotransferase [Candidatus Korobacteraceae bacterium]
MNFTRSSGILLHPTSLPSRFGIGELGPEAHAFADFLRDSGQRVWQVLPLGPTGYGDSPYQCFSAFAGNPLLISIDRLVERGYLNARDVADPPAFPTQQVDYGAVIAWKLPLLHQAFEAFRRATAEQSEFADFCQRHAHWLDDYALFMALKQAHDLIIWLEWDRALALREPAALASARERLLDDIEYHKFLQFEFERQWCDLKAHCTRDDIRIMGDLPIYVALDSADVWVHRELFELNDDGHPRVVAGVPPDYFSATGQLWGNPIYRWEQHAKTCYRWWTARFRRALELLDMIRLDHFRGFEAYYEIPAGDVTAVNGSWVKGPGAPFFEAITAALGELPIVAENLGVITPEVEALRKQFYFPGMAILQFAFGNDPQAPDFKPHNYVHHLVAYTGTHDNDTVVGWWNSQAGAGSIRTAADVEKEMAYARRYLNTDGSDINWVMIRTLMASVANTVLFPLQDVLGVGSEGRMNLPGSSSGNWRWRFPQGSLTPEISARLKDWAETYER